MLNRFVITLGAPTTAGGQVITADDFKTVEGRPVAREGDKCWCPQCQTEGVIALEGPRMSAMAAGREIALDGDLCLCACSPPPRLVAVQDFKSQAVDGERFASDAAEALRTAAALNAAAIAPQETDKLPLALVDPGSGEPLGHRPYRLELAGEVIEGTLDANGWTEPLSAAQRAAVLAWHVE